MAINDSSYTVAGAALKGMVSLDSTEAYVLAKRYASNAEGALGRAVAEILVNKGAEEDFDIIANSYRTSPPSQDKIEGSEKFGNYLLKVNDVEKIKTGIDYMLEFRNLIPEQYRSFIDPTFCKILNKISAAKWPAIKACLLYTSR